MPQPIYDQRMLQLIDILKTMDVIGSDAEFARAVGMRQRQNIINIRKGTRSFTAAQIHQAGVVYKVSTDWINGFSNKKFRINPVINRKKDLTLFE